MSIHAKPLVTLPTRSLRRLLATTLLASLALPFAPAAAQVVDELVLDQQAVNPDTDSALYGLVTTLNRAQTFTVGISGTLAFVEVKVSGDATSTFEIHPTLNGEAVLGTTPLGSATVSYSRDASNPVHAPLDFTAAQIPVKVGDVLAIVAPGGGTTKTGSNTPYWHRLRNTVDYPGGSSYWNSDASPTAYDFTSTLDFGFATYVDPDTPIEGAVEFDPSDRTTRPVFVYPESTPCPLTGVDGLVDPDCERYAAGPTATFGHAPLRGDIVAWTGDLATLVVPADEVARYLTDHLGVTPITTSALQMTFSTNNGFYKVGHLDGLPGDYFFTARLPTPQGPLDFTWWNRSQNDRGFEGDVLVGTGFDARVVASCATEGDAPDPVDTNGICFLQGPASPGFSTLYKTVTAYAQKDATFPVADYSPELDTLDFAIVEAIAPPVPSVGPPGLVLLAAAVGALGAFAARSRRGPRGCSLGLIATIATIAAGTATLAPGPAAAEGYEGSLEIGVSESFAGSGSGDGASLRWHRTLRTATGRIALPSSTLPPGFAHGTRVRVEGTLENGELSPLGIQALDSGGSVSSQAAVVPSTETLGAQRTLVTLLNFTNDTSQPYTVASVRALLMDEAIPTSTASYVREASYGKTWLTGGVVGWIPVGYDDSSCQLWWAGGGAATLVAAMDPYIDYSQWDRWIIVIPPNPSCAFVGYSSLGKETWSTADGTVSFSRMILNGTRASTPAVAAHELGHGIGALQHALDYECGASVVDDECGTAGAGTDRYDVIAATIDYGHYGAPNKEALHWLDGSELMEVNVSGSFLLEPYESQAAATKVLKIPASWRLDDLQGASAYYLSYRTPTGFDAIYPELATDGVMVHLDGDLYTPTSPSVVGSTYLLDLSPGGAATQVDDSADVILGVGQSFTDAVHGITIDVLGRVGSALEVEVTLTQVCGNGVADPNVGEACDGVDLAGQTCASLGFTSGTLACDSGCGFDLSMCGVPRCGPGHAFDEATDTCTADFALDPSERGPWRNWSTWSGARSATFAQGFSDEYSYMFLANSESPTNSVIYRRTLSFDTSSIPDGVEVLAADLRLKILENGYPGQNSHPAGADQLVLVQPMPASPPVVAQDEFDVFGSLDFPVEGAPRIDIGDLQTGQGFEASFSLDATGLSWIDPTGVSLFGLRGGFDVDDAPPAGQSLSFLVYMRSEASPVAGPRLTVTYRAVPEPGVVAGTGAGGVALLLLSRRRSDRRSRAR